MSGHIINDFKDLRSLIGEITKANPAKTTYQQNAEKMGVTKEAEAKPKDDKGDRGIARTLGKKHAGEDDIKKAYMKLGRAAQGSVEHQRKLVQKQLAKMGFKTYSKFGFDNIFKFESNQMIAKWLINEEVLLESVLSDMQSIVKNKQAKKIGGVMVDMFTASVITKAYDQVNDANKKKMEKANLDTLVKVAHKLMGMKEDIQEGGMKRLFQDLEDGASAKEISKKYGIDMKTAKTFVDNYKKVASAPRLRAAQNDPMKEENLQERMKLKNVMRKHGRELKKVAKSGNLELSKKAEDDLMAWAMNSGEIRTDDPDEFDQWLDNNIDDLVKGKIKEGKYLKYSDLLLKKSRLIDKEGPNSPTVKAINKEIGKEMKKLGISEEVLQEGTWAVPDSKPKLEFLQKEFLNKPIKATDKNARTLATRMYNVFGDDSFFDDLLRVEQQSDPKGDLRDIIVKHLKPWGVSFSGYKITKALESWVNSDEPNVPGLMKKFEDTTLEVKRGRGNIRKPKGKIVPLRMSKEDKLKEEQEHAKQSPFKLKSQAYPRAIAVNTDGFGHRHATVEDIIAACDSFGMILDKELQVEQVQKQLGKEGFISFKQTDLDDVFEERETQRMILALESDVEEQGPIEYTKNEITEAFIMGEEIEFLKPDGYKTAGPVLKKSGNTFNVKDKFTGKSFTYKYSDKENVKIEEGEVKTFKQITEDVQLGPNMLRKDFPNVWATKDSKLYRVLAWLISMHGFVDNWKSYKKDKKDFLDSLRSIAKSDANMRKAGMSSRDIQYIKNPKPDQNFAEDIQEARFSKQLIKQAGGIAFDKRYYMGNMSGAVKAIEKLKKGLSDDPKVREMLRIANESDENLTALKFASWLPEGGDSEAYQKFFKKALKKFGVNSPDELEGEKKRKFFNYVDSNWKGDHEEKEIKVDARRKNFREKMKKLGYIKGT